MNQAYIDQARLLVRVAPLVFDETLALKGGTAINLFISDMPRLSVDLDLTFLDYRLKRDDALASISNSMRNAAARLEGAGFATFPAEDPEGIEHTLYVEQRGLRVKVEVNKIIRGTVDAPRQGSLAPRARQVLQADVEIPVVSDADVYGGKLVAALDRQHPRDLFDVGQLFEREGLTAEVRRAFVVYLASHNRPIHEVLFAREKDISQIYASSFVGMTAEPVPFEELLAARTRLMRELPASLSDEQRRFLMSLAAAQPDWNLLEVPHAAELPAIRWKLHNLEKFAQANSRAFQAQRDELQRRFNEI